MLCTYYRGRTTFMEMMNMPLDYINALYNIAIERQKEDQRRREEAKAKGINDSMIHVDFMVGNKDLDIVGVDAKGNKPYLLIIPYVGLKPTIPQYAAGFLIESPVSLPVA